MLMILDIESTGLDPAADAVVELAIATLVRREGTWELGPMSGSLVAPGRRISPAAQATHHLTDAELRGAPHLRQATVDVLIELGVEDGCHRPLELSAIAAHNAPFDRSFMAPMLTHLGVTAPWLCTLRAAKHIYPELPSYANQNLRYTLPGVDAEVRQHLPPGLAPHRALYDAITTAILLKHLLTRKPLEELLALQNRPILLKTCNLKKHKGLLWSQVPKDYLSWILRADPPFDADIQHTARHYLNP